MRVHLGFLGQPTGQEIHLLLIVLFQLALNALVLDTLEFFLTAGDGSALFGVREQVAIVSISKVCNCASVY